MGMTCQHPIPLGTMKKHYRSLKRTEKSTKKPMEDEESNSSKKPSSIKNPLSQLQESQLEEEEDEEEIESSRQAGESINKKIIKELHNIQRQNAITHYLLTASILLTLSWQLSELSLLFRIKQSFNNPLKSIGGAIKYMLNTTSQKTDQRHQRIPQVIPPTYLPGLKIPDLPGFDTSTGTEDNGDD